jgi:pyrroloquinoline-quinone synthase
VNLFERLDAVADRWNVLRHPFYLRWEAGELSRDELAYYAGEYRHAVVALADLATAASTPEHGAEERAHVDLWDAFARELDADLDRPARPETQACVAAWSSEGSAALGALYAIEAAQPEVARVKREGLVAWYGFEAKSRATAYFDVHVDRDFEHAAQTRRRLLSLGEREEQVVLSGAEQALRGNWELLDGVESASTSRAGSSGA